jgi:hypothetical protein
MYTFFGNQFMHKNKAQGIHSKFVDLVYLFNLLVARLAKKL